MRRRSGPLGGKLLLYKRHRLGHGTTTHELVTLPENVAPPEPNAVTLPVFVPDIESLPQNEDEEPALSVHHQRKKAEVDQWAGLRALIQKAAVDSAAPCQLVDTAVTSLWTTAAAADTAAAFSTVCQLCSHVTERVLRCEQCSAQYFGCEDCVVQDHRHRPTHSLEMWLVIINEYHLC